MICRSGPARHSQSIVTTANKTLLPFRAGTLSNRSWPSADPHPVPGDAPQAKDSSRPLEVSGTPRSSGRSMKVTVQSPPPFLTPLPDPLPLRERGFEEGN
jgi:hypothetical protein